MTKTLTRIGNSLGVVIEKPILDLLQITADTELKISTDGERLIIEPQRSKRKHRLKDAADRAMKAHKRTFRRLAK